MALTAQSFLTLSSIAPGRSSRLHPVSELIFVSLCWSANPGVSIGERCLWVCEIGAKWASSCLFVGCCLQVLFSSHLFFLCFVSVHVVVWAQSPLGTNPVLFWRIDQISMWSITCQESFTPLQGICWHPFQLMRCCCWCIWTSLLISEASLV